MRVSPTLPSVTPLRILLIDADPVFRLGVKVWINQYPDLEVVAEAADGESALQILAETAPFLDSPALPIHLVLLDVGLGQAYPEQIQGLDLCVLLKASYPLLPILFLSASAEPIVLAAAQRTGANGYCPKTVEPEELMAVIRQVAAGQPCWIREWQRETVIRPGSGIEPPVQVGPDSPDRTVGLNQRNRPSNIQSGASSFSQATSSQAASSQAAQSRRSSLNQQPRPPVLHPLTALRYNLRISGIDQIESALTEVNFQLQSLDLSLLERAVLAGRYRELRASRWLVNQLLATPGLERSSQVSPTARPIDRAQINHAQINRAQINRPSAESLQPQMGSPPASSPGSSPRSQPARSQPAQSPVSTQPKTLPMLPDAVPTGALSDASLAPQVSSPGEVELPGIQSVAFDAVLAKVQTGLTNQSGIPMETDILREDKKRDLLYLILRKLEDLLSELRYSQIEPAQLPWKRSELLLDLWQASVTDFFGKYYTVRVRTMEGVMEVGVVERLLQEAPTVQAAILDKIPGVTELLLHLRFQTPLLVDSTPYAAGNPESLARASLLLENLILQVANAIIQPLLNYFANVEDIKHTFYDRQLLSTREVERFRNNLSWKYRVERVFREPKNMFESQHQVFTFTGRSIQQTSIYAPRTTELQQLSGLPYVVTLALEARDAISPRLQSAIALAGNSLVYVLTEVIGRGIGLIGRGVLKGLGNVWQDSRYRRDRNSR